MLQSKERLNTRNFCSIFISSQVIYFCLIVKKHLNLTLRFLFSNPTTTDFKTDYDENLGNISNVCPLIHELNLKFNLFIWSSNRRCQWAEFWLVHPNSWTIPLPSAALPKFWLVKLKNSKDRIKQNEVEHADKQDFPWYSLTSSIKILVAEGFG